MPEAEVDIDADLVARLIADQHPDLAGRRLHSLANGWDNASFRLGDDLVVRLPRRGAAAELVVNEQRWMGTLAVDLPLPIPAPIRVGRPAAGYPWVWSVGPWLPGAPWEMAPPHDTAAAASDLGSFLAALHRDAPAEAPHNPFRGVPLVERAERFDRGLAELGDRVDARRCRAVFAELADSPEWGGVPVWLHGDLHPLNVLVDDRRVSAVIDFGDVCAGDPATDLAMAWMILPDNDRNAFRAAAGQVTPVDDATWQRSRAWALALAIAYLASSDDNPAIATIGRRTLTAALNNG
jgi:aminoglycoside phosphotransferase (APT) family kinase protein